MKWIADFFGRFIWPKDKSLAPILDTLETEVVLNAVINWCGQNIESENTVWMSVDEYARRSDQAHGLIKSEKSQTLFSSIRFLPLVKIDEADLNERLKPFEREVLRPLYKNVSLNYDLLYPLTDHNQKVQGYLFVMGVNKSSLSRVQRALNWLSQNVSKHLGFSFQFWRAQGSSYCDDLTGLYNQKFLENVVEAEIHRAKRMDGAFTVLFLDIDRFKLINDVNGHWVGSKLLVEVARVLKSVLRKSDYAFRYGGDEFVVVLPDTKIEGGQVAAERVRAAIETTDFIIDGVHLKLTVSIGLASYPQHAKSYREVVQMADSAMYCGKNKSRNIVFVANS